VNQSPVLTDPVVFNVGRTDAEYAAKELSRIDPLQVKHEVADEYAVERTHPVFYNVAEQWQGFTEYLQDLPPHHFVLKVRGQKVRVGKTRHLPAPKVDPKELLEVEQEYLRRYFRAKQDVAPDAAPVNTTEEQGMRQARLLSTPILSGSTPITRRQRLR
jgi:hypothetical protein